MQGVESTSKEVPVGDHAQNGEIECAVRELKRQMRAMRLALESKLGKALDAKDPVLAWMPSFAADVLSRYRRGRDGKTAWQRETGKQWAKGALQFGEKIMIKEAKERIGVPKRDWEPRLISVRYMGHHARTGSIIGLTSEGVKWGESSRRLPYEDRWSHEGWDELRGLPWDMKPQRREAPLECQDDEAPVLAQPPHREPEATREFYVRRTDVENYGPTPGCERCRTIADKLPAKGVHTSECRERMKEFVRDTEQERFVKYEEKQVRGALRQQVREEEGSLRAPKRGRPSEEVAPSPMEAETTSPVPGSRKREAEESETADRKERRREELRNAKRKAEEQKIDDTAPIAADAGGADFECHGAPSPWRGR